MRNRNINLLNLKISVLIHALQLFNNKHGNKVVLLSFHARHTNRSNEHQAAVLFLVNLPKSLTPQFSWFQTHKTNEKTNKVFSLSTMSVFRKCKHEFWCNFQWFRTDLKSLMWINHKLLSIWNWGSTFCVWLNKQKRKHN